MSRKPRLIVVAEDWTRADVMKDDLYLRMDGNVAFWEGEDAVANLVVDAERTRPHANPIDYFSEIATLPDGRPLWFNIDAEHEYIREKYPWISPFCNLVQICPSKNTFGVFYDDSRSFWFKPRALNVDGEKAFLVHQECVFSKAKDPFCNVIVTHTLEESLDKGHKVLQNSGGVHYLVNRGLVNYSSFYKTARIHVCEFSFRDSHRKDVLGVLAFLNEKWGCSYHVSRRNFVFQRNSPGWITDFEIPYHHATLSMGYYYDQIMEAAIGLLSVVPPYVVLWIVDFFPKIKWLPRVKKIQMIEAIRDSLNRILVKKNLEPYWSYDI